jgi:DNA-binding Lrp family transcriptional regulator/ferredoxin
LYHPDRLDAGILRELQNPASRWDIRKSFVRIAKRLMVDEETVRRRVTKMEALGVIQGWTITPNPHLLDRDSVGVYLELRPGINRHELAERLTGVEGVTSVHSFHGDSLLVFADYPTGSPHDARVAEIEGICGTRSTLVLDSKFPPFGLVMTLTDWMILRSLRRGARRKLGILAREAGVSAKTFNRRLERLIEGRAFFLEVRVDFQRMAGLAYTLVVDYEGTAQKERADPVIVERLGEGYEWSDTRSDPMHSLFSAFSSNLGEAKQIVQWAMTLKGVTDVKMGIEESRLSAGAWIDEEIRLRSASAPTAKELVATARWVPPSPPPIEVPVTRRAEDSWWTGSLVEGRNVRVSIDADLCMGSASCVAMAPKVFRLDWAKRRSSMGEPAPLEVLRAKGTEPGALFLAAQSCPYGVIRIEDVDTGEQLYP